MTLRLGVLAGKEWVVVPHERGHRGQPLRIATEGQVLGQVKGLAHANPGFADRLIHAGYRQAGYGMLTCERAAASLNSVEVVTESE